LKKHKGDPLCGECRQPKGKPHRIYLDLEDLVDDQVALVADGLNSINFDTSPADIEKFNRAVRKLREKHHTDPAVSVSSLLGFYDHSLILLQKALLEAVRDLKDRVAPSAERCSEFKHMNEALNRQLEDLRSQTTIFREKLKRAKLTAQTEKEETRRLRLAVDRQRIAKEAVVTENKKLQAKLESRDKEASCFVLFMPSIHF
jgi:septal ring factor EnvC (AmiA/AmiB activator)